jgi:hypothetical protein
MHSARAVLFFLTALVTLFAPTNAAMDKLTGAEWLRLQADKHNGCLHHTVDGDILTTALKPTQALETLAGDTVVVTRDLSTSVVHIAAALVATSLPKTSLPQTVC